MDGKETKSIALSPLVPEDKDGLIEFCMDDSRPANLRIKALKMLLKLDPSLADRLGGDFVSRASHVMLQAMSGHDGFATEVGMAKMRHEKGKLVGDDPDPVLGGLADRVVMSWLRVQEAEIQAAAQRESASAARLKYLEDRIAATQNNYLSAMRSFNSYRNERDRLRMLTGGSRR